MKKAVSTKRCLLQDNINFIFFSIFARRKAAGCLLLNNFNISARIKASSEVHWEHLILLYYFCSARSFCTSFYWNIKNPRMNQEAFLASVATQDVHRTERISSYARLPSFTFSRSTFLAYFLHAYPIKKKSLWLLLGNSSAEIIVKCVSPNHKILFTNVKKKLLFIRSDTLTNLHRSASLRLAPVVLLLLVLSCWEGDG